MQSIIWDWNGTLLNDIDLCISTINTLLQKRNLDLINTKIYKEVFAFPVKDYYAAIGFDFRKEDFAVPAREYIDFYDSQVHTCTLHNMAIEMLEHLRSEGKRQFVLSAMKQDMLEKTLKEQGIFHFFEGVTGLDDHYAVSKIERGEEMISRFNIQKEKTIIIGDTIHDFEVAKELGIYCVLIANGHQSEERLKTTGAPVVPNLEGLLKMDGSNF